MGTVKHKRFGEAKIIHRDGDRITIKYDKSGMETELKIPESFTVGIFEIDADLQREVDAALEAQEEKRRVERAEREAQRAWVQVVHAPAAETNRARKKPAKVKVKGTIEMDFEEYLIASGYSEETPSGAPSTVNAYLNAVALILDAEHLTWQSLIDQISMVVALYDIGGAKEDIGSKSNYTYINALRRFEDFVNNSTL
ncbi:MAG: hypothetical protein IJX76_01050 [Clostridia bacterium]|nr:hypothetical protein [Clostridia bacterium]